jgi:hypothetical protein
VADAVETVAIAVEMELSATVSRQGAMPRLTQV